MLAPIRLPAQTVVEMQGGASSLTGGYGATSNFWHQGVDGWVGIGWLDGLRVGAFLRTAIGRDTLRLGNDVLSLRYPTDVFGGGFNVLVQGAQFQHTTRDGNAVLFAGASSAGLAAPSFSAWKARAPMGALLLERRVSPTVRLSTSAVFAETETIVPGVEWHPTPDVTTALAAGTGGGRPYAASSLVLTRGPLTVRGSYVYNPRRFRPASTPAPSQSQLDRENLLVTYEVGSAFSIGVGHQNFVQDSADAVAPIRASGNSFYLGGRLGEMRLTAGVYDSRSDTLSNLSSFIAVGRQLTSWLDAEAFLLQSRPHGRPSSTTPLMNLRERISPRIGLMQQLSRSDGRLRVRFGGSLLTALGEIGVDYEVVHQPFQPLDPFRSALNLTARIQLGSYSTNIGTFIAPDGSVDYSASGSTFLYMGQYGAMPPRAIGAQIAHYIVRGRVLDDAGQPVEGAAVAFNGQTAFTNSKGELMLRTRHPEHFHPEVLLDQFLLPGHWRVVSVPEEVVAQPEQRATMIDIMLERAVAAALAPEPR